MFDHVNGAWYICMCGVYDMMIDVQWSMLTQFGNNMLILSIFFYIMLHFTSFIYLQACKLFLWPNIAGLKPWSTVRNWKFAILCFWGKYWLLMCFIYTLMIHEEHEPKMWSLWYRSHGLQKCITHNPA